MNHLSPHLASLRHEIDELRKINAVYSRQNVHNAAEQKAAEDRADRLLQIKLELSKMRDCPPEPRVWWDKVRKPKRTA